MQGRFTPLAVFLVCATAAHAARSQQSRQTATPAQLPQHFEIDAAHSMMGFSVGFMGLSKVRGAFATYAGTIMYAPSPDAPQRSSASIIILAKSISTNNTTRDNHLRSPDFFDATKYPYITFRSTAIRRTRKGYTVDGEFAMHGVTKALSIPLTLLNAPKSDAWGNQRMTLQGNLRLSRKEYGIKGTAFWNGEFDPGRMAVSDDVDVELLISATIPNVDKWVDPVGDSLLAEVNRQGLKETLGQLKAARAGNPKIDSIPAFAYVVVAEKLAKAGRLGDAVEVYATAIEIQPQSGLLMARRAALLAKLGDIPAATELFERVSRMDSTSTIAAEWLRVLRARR
jgi:polyisoprenoid-binding protein YceI